MLLAFAAVAAAIVTLAVVFRRRIPKRRPALPYVRQNALLTRGELVFFEVLRTVVPAGALLCMKVRVADVITVPDHQWDKFGRPIAGLHLDFVFVDAKTTAVLLAVELDDKSHRRRHRQERDGFLNAAMAAAGVPLVRVRAAARYDAREIRRLVEGAVG